MKKRKKDQRLRPSSVPPVRAAASPRLAISPWKKSLFAVGTTVGFFVFVEILLALAGINPVLYEEDPFVSFVSTSLLFDEQVASSGETYLRTSPNRTRWFNLQEFPKRKEKGTYRIFSVGGSTTYGRPYNDTTSFSGWLREFLQRADPGRTWEVVNAGGISYASYRVTAVMEELIRYEPDLFVVYSGHNEFLEGRTYQTVLEAPKTVTAFAALASRTRIYAAGKNMITSLSREPDGKAADTELKGEVDTILANSVGPQDYRRDDTFRARVLAHYRFNLNRMIDMAHAVDADVVLVVPASNLKDCAPFKSEHTAGLSATDIQQFGDLMTRAESSRDQGRLKLSLKLLDQAQAIDRRYAEVHYQRGRVLSDLGLHAEAKEAFDRAVDEDVCPLRALSEIRNIVKEVAAQRGVSVLDFAAEIEDRADQGIPGSDYFLDHVHLTIEGYRLLALRLIDILTQRGVVHLAESWGPESIEAVTHLVEGQLDQRSHGVALRNLAKVFDWAGKLEEAERLAEQAEELLGEDAATYHLLGRNSEARGQWEEAIRYYRRALEISPDHAEAHSSLGMALAVMGRNSEAIEHFRKALSINPDHPRAHGNLGAALMAQGKPEEAIRQYRRALQLEPKYTEALNNLGVALSAVGRQDEAVTSFQQALAIKPGYTEALTNLGSALIEKGVLDEAIRHLREAVRIDPNKQKAHTNLGIALFSKGKIGDAIQHYQEALRISPDSAEPHYNLGLAYNAMREYEAAIRQYREALRLQTDYAEAHSNLGITLLSNGRPQQAIQHLRRAVDIKTDSGQAYYNLGIALAMTGRGEDALRYLRGATNREPQWPAPFHRMAWILATDRNDNLRNGKEALLLAKRAVDLSKQQDPEALDALAAAYAEIRDFESAMEVGERSLRLYSATGATAKAASLRERVAGYQRGRPHREVLSTP